MSQESPADALRAIAHSYVRPLRDLVTRNLVNNGDTETTSQRIGIINRLNELEAWLNGVTDEDCVPPQPVTTDGSIHVAQFSRNGIAKEPALFANLRELHCWVSAQLDAGTLKLFPRLEGEDVVHHVARLQQLQTMYHKTDRIDTAETWRHGVWHAAEDYLNIWELRLRQSHE